MPRLAATLRTRLAATLREGLLDDPREASSRERTSSVWLARSALFLQRAVRRAKQRRDERYSFIERLEYDRFPRTHYAYGVYHAALLAKALGIGAISAYEFGVGWGHGLIELERVADMVERETSVSIDVYGFDTGAGMPEPADYRDLPNVWQPGFFDMDVEKLERSLTRAKLVLGNVRETVDGFIETEKPAPVGFVAIDVDYYSSTVDVLRLFDAPEEFLLPRIYCYLDDIIGDDWQLMCEYVGQLLAVREFNEQHDERKITPIHGFRSTRRMSATWNDQMYVAHAFDHSLYCKYVNPKREWALFKHPPSWYQLD